MSNHHRVGETVVGKHEATRVCAGKALIIIPTVASSDGPVTRSVSEERVTTGNISSLTRRVTCAGVVIKARMQSEKVAASMVGGLWAWF